MKAVVQVSDADTDDDAAENAFLKGHDAVDVGNGTFRTSGETVLSARTLPVNFKTELVDACMTKNAIMADKAATSFSCFAMPMATPTAKMIGKLPKMMLPASLMMVSRE